VRRDGEEVRTSNACMFAHCEHFILCIDNDDDFETQTAILTDTYDN
jgi:hypothetical protein